MESCNSEEMYRNSSSSSSSPRRSGVNGVANRYGINISASNLIHSPFAALLEYSGILGGGGGGGGVASSSPSSPSSQEREELIPSASDPDPATAHSGSAARHQEVTIRIIGSAEHHHHTNPSNNNPDFESQTGADVAEGTATFSSDTAASSSDEAPTYGFSTDSSSSSSPPSSSSSYQRYDIQNIARWFEQILPFSLLLLLVFVRQHLQGFCVTLWVSAVLFKSNDILKKQTALKGERKNSVLIGATIAFIFHVLLIYWWHRNDDLLYPLILLPPKAVPPFWNAVFIIVMNDVMSRQASMVLKCILLMYYKNSKGHNYRKQGQMLTLVEYLLLLYRVLLPTPVWYRFFLNKEYGSLFSSLITGLYLTFKLTSVWGKVQLFFAALRALSRKSMHYGSHATSEQVNAAGDLCAICQEKMHVPILLCCKHIFCEDCVSEWFERERTCPLCRAMVKPADIRSYSDGSTSLFFQLF